MTKGPDNTPSPTHIIPRRLRNRIYVPLGIWGRADGNGHERDPRQRGDRSLRGDADRGQHPLDRFIQQAVAQALTLLFEPPLSPHSYRFRPKGSAHNAIKQAQVFRQQGYGWVGDIDLEGFFDRPNHDILIVRVTRVVRDTRVLRLIPAHLESEVMIKSGVIGGG